MFHSSGVPVPFRTISSIALSCCIATASLPAIAITNIENERPGPPDEGWSGQAELGLSGKSGDVDKEHYHGAGRLTWHQNKTTVFGLAQRTYGETRGLKDTDDTFLHLRGIQQLRPWFAAEGFVQWQQNAFANLSSRTLAGGGGRFDVLNEPDVVSLSVGLGAFREREELDLGTYREVNWAWRMNSYAAYRHQLNSQVRLVSTFYYQPDVNNLDDYRVLFDAGLSVALHERLRLKLSYALSHNSDPAVNLDANPPINKAETNTGYTTSLTYSF
jgi:putative salt-induced outer membrane protein YdiY